MFEQNPPQHQHATIGRACPPQATLGSEGRAMSLPTFCDRCESVYNAEQVAHG